MTAMCCQRTGDAFRPSRKRERRTACPSLTLPARARGNTDQGVERMNVARLLRPLVTVLSVAAAAGCAGEKKWERPKVVRAGGVVRYQGKPLEGAQVTFTHTTSTISALGHTDAEGRFTLTTFELDDG